MATSTKLSFRARNLDSNKVMCIFFASELPDLSECTPIARAVAQMPTGMEKEEEMESHLQDAILAQQASTSGVRMDNHVIPTPKVLDIDETRYDDTYPSWPCSSKTNLIKVQAWLSLDKEEADYDVDSEDDLWLSEHPHIDARTLERIFDTLETQSSDSHICLPKDARSALTSFDVCVVDDVYDYWLSKRKATLSSAAALGVGGLIPRVRTECRKDSQGVMNPYVAFRRRAEKMQTRKNRKNDEDSYEKVLKLGHDLRKTVTLFDMVKRREKTKLALIDLESEILAQRMFLDDFGTPLCDQLLNKLRSEMKTTINNHDREDDTPKKKLKRRRIRQPNIDREVPSKAWLKKNAEVWNRPPTACAFNAMISPVVEVDRSTQAACDANQDGRYTFKRRRGCHYRSVKTEPEVVEVEKVPVENRLYTASMLDFRGCPRTINACRRRLGRGGRVIFDRITDSQAPRVPKIYDPFDDDFVIDHSVAFRAQYRNAEAMETSSVVDHERCALEERMERQWLESARSPSPYNSSPRDPPSKLFFAPPGNGKAGRVEQLNVTTKMCTTRMISEDWREGSGSPSESNSSAEWAAPTLGSRQVEYSTLSSEDEARTGDHPEAKQPPTKETAYAATVIECSTTPYLLATPSVGTS